VTWTGVQYALQVQEMGLCGVACPEGALVATMCAFAWASNLNCVHDLKCAACTTARHATPGEPGRGDGACVQYNDMRKAMLIRELCRNHRVDTARKMLGLMARMVTTRTRLAMRRLILLAEMVPVYMSLFSCYVEFRVLFLVINEMV
jgi:pentatricopeptide repeat protein